MANMKYQVRYEILRLAQKYYAKPNFPIDSEDDLKKLSPRQLDNIINWATNTDPNKQAKIKGRKYSGKTYAKIKRVF